MADTTQPQPKKQSKYFCIATEGATTDGRNIERAWIEQSARNYDQKKYCARVNLEHIPGTLPLPASPFGAYGSVLALSTEERDGKLCLLAQIEANQYLIELNRNNQKIFTSCEFAPKFADTGEAYLIGLAITDTPASLGCEMLKFAATAKENPLANRKKHKDNLFTEAVPVTLEFEESGPGLLERIRSMFSSQNANNDKQISDISTAVQMLASEVVALKQQGSGTQSTQSTQGSQPDQTEIQALKADNQRLTQDLASLREQLSQQPGGTQRPTSTGGAGEVLTNC